MAMIKVMECAHFDSKLPYPQYETEMAAGADLRACFEDRGTLTIEPGQRLLIGTGLMFEIEPGFEVQIRPRSGLSLKTGLMVVNSPGTIDADYRGEIKIILGNLGNKAETIQHGDRIAQMLVAPVTQAKFAMACELSTTERAEGGFGSTGLQ